MIEPTRTAAARLSLYQEQGYSLLQLSATQDITALLPHLKHHTSVLAGQSGMGKSTILNALIPEARRATAEISTALDSGCHTTTHTHLYQLDTDSYLIDTPGIQAFGLNYIKDENLVWGFVEFHPYIGQCKFNDCRHLSEPDCALLNAVKEGKIHQRRLDFYHKLLHAQC
jgi:ribosome biogenesis GTPase